MANLSNLPQIPRSLKRRTQLSQEKELFDGYLFRFGQKVGKTPSMNNTLSPRSLELVASKIFRPRRVHARLKVKLFLATE